MIDLSDIFAFCIAIFIAITFTNAGLYLTDELSPVNQLHQLAQGHQLTYFENKYGYDNGVADKYMIGVHNVMIYSLMEATISYPIYIIITMLPDASRAIFLIFWLFILLSIITTAGIFYKQKLGNKIYYFYSLLILIIFINIITYSPFTDNLEVVAIVTTNIILYGIFGMMIWKFICYAFYDDVHRIFIWITTLSCSSLLFWVGALKDHVITSVLFIIILYTIIKFYDSNNKEYLIYSAISSGLIIWERPELSLIIIPLICLLLIYKYKNFILQPLLTYLTITSICTIPMLINNYIVTGSVLKFPFQAINQTIGAAHLASSKTIIDILLIELPTFIISNISTISLYNITSIILYPANGAIGLLTTLMISIIIILLLPYIIFIKKIELLNFEKILLLFSISTMIMYFLVSALGFNLHGEAGMLPDLRYFVLIYAPLIIASMSLLSRTFILNYNIMIKNFVISMSIMIVIFTIIISIISGGIMNTEHINLAANIMSIIIGAFAIAIFIDTIRTHRNDGLEIIIPLIISIPLTWQIFVSVITIKLYSSPMYLPIAEIIKKLIFG